MRRFLSLRDFDWTLLAFVLLLSVISVFEIYSATQHTQFRHFQMHRMQMLWIAGGLVAMFIMSVIDYHKLLTIIYWIYGFCLAGLVAVLAVGTRVNGGKRWIKLPGGAHFQPSEWVKLVLILLVARYFSNLAGRELSWKDIFKAIGLRRAPHAAGSQAAGHGYGSDLHAGASGRPFPRGHRLAKGRHPGSGHCAGRRRYLEERQGPQALPERPASPAS